MTRIAIVGAGPSGTVFCLGLLAAGVAADDIVLLDAAEFPRQKLCGGGVTWRGTETLAKLLPDLQPGARTNGLEFQAGQHHLQIREPGPQWLFDRAELDSLLLARCRAAGVTIREQFRVSSLTATPGGWSIESGSGSENATWVVGCDGATGVVRRLAGLPSGRIGRLVEGIFTAGHRDLAADRLYFSFDAIGAGIPGYGWIFPYPKPGAEGLWKIGVMDGRGVVPGQQLRDWTRQYAELNGFVPAEDRLAGWPEHYFCRRTRSSTRRLLLVGEANGIDPLLGEGITPAIHHSLYAARRLRQALDRGQDRVQGFETGFLRTTEGWNLYFLQVLADFLYGPNPGRWLNMLFTTPSLDRLARSGAVAYGRFSSHAIRLTSVLAGEAFKRLGLPRPDWDPGEPAPHGAIEPSITPG